MIARLLAAARRRAGTADALLKSDETITLTLDPAGPPVIEHRSGFAACLRLRRDGRVGHAGAVSRDTGDLVDRAIRSAEAGPLGELHLPGAAPLPRVATSDRSAAAAGTRAVLDLARLLRESLPEHARDAEVWAERSAGSVEVGNTRDVLARYECTLVGFGVRRAGSGPHRAPLALHRAGVAWPDALAVQALAAEVTRLLHPPLLGGYRLPEALPVCFAPAAVRSLLQPLRRALHAAPRDRAPRSAGEPDDPVLPAWLTLSDDPLAPGRPGSRPVDDEGVVALPRILIERGRVVSRITDLETGIRLGIPATGHGRRPPFGPARAGFSNLVLAPGAADRSALLADAGETLLIERLPVLDRVRGGFVAATTPWAYRVVDGEVVGRLEAVAIRGRLPEMLDRLVALGREAVWEGAWCGPALTLDAIEVGPA